LPGGCEGFPNPISGIEEEDATGTRMKRLTGLTLKYKSCVDGKESSQLVIFSGQITIKKDLGLYKEFSE